jgi:SAM-dependent methyltransferase
MSNDRQQIAAYDSWAEYYDLIEGDRTATITFYRSLITNETRSLLELACGTGTITIPLAEQLVRQNGASASNRVIGLDESHAMLRIAHARNSRIGWVRGDMRLPPLETGFDLVICCFNTVQRVLGDDELSQFFGSVRRLVSPSGIFAFDIYQPNLAFLSTPKLDRLARSVTDDRGRRLELREDYSYDPETRILSIKLRVVEQGSKPADALARIQYPVRQYFADEIVRHLAGTGFTVRHRYGDLDRSPFTRDSRKQVFICARS